MLYPIILSGGRGTRLWPLSRSRRPKQFLSLLSEKSLLQDTLLRLRGLEFLGSPVITCQWEHRSLVDEQLREIGVTSQCVISEPVARSTAPAVAVATMHLVRHDPEALMLILPSDHAICDVDAFHRAVHQAVKLARQGYLVTFGIVPERPETGYGYIQQGFLIARSPDAYRVSRFVEKPDETTAERFVASKTYLWNSGMFLFSARTFLDELARLQPDMFDACQSALEKGLHSENALRPQEDEFARCAALSIDYAVMERTDRAAVIGVEMGWSDVGGWRALWELGDKDPAGNVVRGPVYLEDVRNCLVMADQGKIAAIGVENLMVVKTADGLLIVPRDSGQEPIKRVVQHWDDEETREKARAAASEADWGEARELVKATGYRLQHMTLVPHRTLSFDGDFVGVKQWLVLRGRAEIRAEGKWRVLADNQLFTIPEGEAHQLHNPGPEPLAFLEIQTGDLPSPQPAPSAVPSTSVGQSSVLEVTFV